MREQLEREREIGALTAQFYLDVLARTRSAQEALAAGARMVHEYLVGMGVGDPESPGWAQVYENPYGLRSGWRTEGADAEVAAAASEHFDEEFNVHVVSGPAARAYLVAPVFDQTSPGVAAGLFAAPLVAGADVTDQLRVIAMTIAMGAALHADRLARIGESTRSSEFAQASARAQLLLNEPSERDPALQIALDELTTCADITGGVAFDLTGGEPRATANFGELSTDRGRELLSHGDGYVEAEGAYVLPIEIDRVREAAIVLTSDSAIAQIEEEMLESIAAAVSGSIARQRAGVTIETLRRSATRRLVEAQERERSIVAADIHDGVLQQLGATAIRLELAQARVEQHDFHTASEIIADGAQEIRACARELRALLMELRPQVLDDNGLNAALQELGRHVAGVEVSVHSDVPDTIGSEYSITIFRIVQEALTNIEKHAQAQHASVSVDFQDGQIGIEIKDDGIGFEGSVTGPSAQGSHLGLLGMRERAGMLGGRFSISGASGGGTLIEATLPVMTPPSRDGGETE